MGGLKLTQKQKKDIKAITEKLVEENVNNLSNKIKALDSEEDFKLEYEVKKGDTLRTMYKLKNEDGKTYLLGKGSIKYEFLVETDCEDFAYGIYYGCKCILNTKGDVVEQVKQCNDEWEYLKPRIIAALNNTFIDLDFSERTIPTDNVSSMTYWPFWIRLGENEDVNGVAAVATRVIRNVYREFFQGNVVVEPGKQPGPKMVAKTKTRYTQNAYDLVVKELSDRRFYVGNARELFEKFLAIIIQKDVIRRYPIYEKCWIVANWSNCEFGELIARFSEKISIEEVEEDKRRVKWSLFNTILMSKHNRPFDEVRKQYRRSKNLKESRQDDIKNIMEELLS